MPVPQDSGPVQAFSMSTQIRNATPGWSVQAYPEGQSMALPQSRVQAPEPPDGPRHRPMLQDSGVGTEQGRPVSSGTQMPPAHRCSSAQLEWAVQLWVQNRVPPMSSVHRPEAQSPPTAQRSRYRPVPTGIESTGGTAESTGGMVESMGGMVESLGGTVESMGGTVESMGVAESVGVAESGVAESTAASKEPSGTHMPMGLQTSSLGQSVSARQSCRQLPPKQYMPPRHWELKLHSFSAQPVVRTEAATANMKKSRRTPAW